MFRKGLALSLIIFASLSFGQQGGGEGTEFTVPGSDNWKVKFTSSGTTSWWNPFGSGSFSWSDGPNTTWFPQFSSTWIGYSRASSTAYSLAGSGASLKGNWNLDFKYYGGKTEDFRSFFTLQSGVTSYGNLGLSVSNGLEHPMRTNEFNSAAWAMGNRVFILTGKSGSKSLSMSAMATADFQATALVDAALILKGNSHPAVTVGLGSSWKKGPQNQRIQCLTDGFGNTEHHFGTQWDPVSKEWRFHSWKTSSQDLYSRPVWIHSPSGGVITSLWQDGNLEAKLGSDVDLPALNKQGNLKSQLFDLDDSKNPNVEIENKMIFHKPLENPEAVGIERTYLSICQNASATGLPASQSDIVEVTYYSPGANFILDGFAATVVNLVLDQAEGHPRLKIFAKAAGFALDAIKSKPQSVSRQMESIFDERWPTTNTANQGRRMGIGIQTTPGTNVQDVKRHRLIGIETVYKNFRSQDWNCDAYSFSGFVGRGIVTTFSPGYGNDVLVQGIFQAIGTTPPPGTGGTVPGGEPNPKK